MAKVSLLLDNGLDFVKRTVFGLMVPNIFNVALLQTFSCQVSLISIDLQNLHF
jgi:hypothetical protein